MELTGPPRIFNIKGGLELDHEVQETIVFANLGWLDVDDEMRKFC